MLVCTYNCLYSDGTDQLTGWEEEMITKTQGYGTYAVKRQNLYYAKARAKRISRVMTSNCIQDAIMLQEVTPGMLQILSNHAKTELPE